ncbi:hypothetical protein M885DRAFT_617452 [Pelagophyceae sp. CCMP2097]|nr:hypothetical protein M885DRAFT_617452 [Pelagophyceae sp. CCMP2097]
MRVDSNVSARRRADGEACNKLRVEFGTFLGDGPASVATFERVGGGRDYYDFALPPVLSVLPDRIRLLNLRDNLSEKFRRPQIKGSMGLRFHVVDNFSNDAAADEPQLLWVGHDDSLLDSLVVFDRAFEGAALVVNISSSEAFTAAEKLKSVVAQLRSKVENLIVRRECGPVSAAGGAPSMAPKANPRADDAVKMVVLSKGTVKPPLPRTADRSR